MVKEVCGYPAPAAKSAAINQSHPEHSATRAVRAARSLIVHPRSRLMLACRLAAMPNNLQRSQSLARARIDHGGPHPRIG
jgi:hypothetical protein